MNLSSILMLSLILLVQTQAHAQTAEKVQSKRANGPAQTKSDLLESHVIKTYLMVRDLSNAQLRDYLNHSDLSVANQARDELTRRLVVLYEDPNVLKRQIEDFKKMLAKKPEHALESMYLEESNLVVKTLIRRELEKRNPQVAAARQASDREFEAWLDSVIRYDAAKKSVLGKLNSNYQVAVGEFLETYGTSPQPPQASTNAQQLEPEAVSETP